MGIIKFNKFLRDSSIGKNGVFSVIKKIDGSTHLLLDFNAMIHNTSLFTIEEINTMIRNVLLDRKNKEALTTLEKYGFNIQILDSNEKIIINAQHFFSKEKLDEIIIEKIMIELFNVIDMVCTNTTTTVILSIDGIPCKAKMIEQRNRRYFSTIMSEVKTNWYNEKIKEYQKKNEDYSQYSIMFQQFIKWTNGNISPRTIFMKKLVIALKNVESLIKSKFSHITEWIIFDDTRMGEGEKKIMNYIYKNKIKKCVICSPDNDMILLSLIPDFCDISLIRLNKNNVYELISINLLKKNLINFFSLESKFMNNIVNDFVFIAIFFGNDFLPRMPCIDIDIDGETILKIYNKIMTDTKEFLIIKESKVSSDKMKLNMKFFLKFLERLIDFEQENLFEIYCRDNIPNYLKIKNALKTDFKNFEESCQKLEFHYNNLYKLQNYDVSDEMLQQIFLLIKKKHISNFDFKKVTHDIVPYKTEFINAIKTSSKIPHLKTFYRKQKCTKFVFELPDIKINPLGHEWSKIENMAGIYNGVWQNKPLNIVTGLYDKNYSISEQYNYYSSRYFESFKCYTNILVDEEYFKGMLWILNYYFNDRDNYISEWRYPFKHAPLLIHLYNYLKNNLNVNKILNEVESSMITDEKNYFNNLAHLVFTTPYTNFSAYTISKEFYNDFKKLSKKFKLVDINKLVNMLTHCIINKIPQNIIYLIDSPYLSKLYIKEFNELSPSENIYRETMLQKDTQSF
jgi:5'-3' exonuclease